MKPREENGVWLDRSSYSFPFLFLLPMMSLIGWPDSVFVAGGRWKAAAAAAGSFREAQDSQEN